jgi:lysozyme family protein
MKGERRLWIAIGLLVSAFATIVLGAMALGGFVGGSTGDLAVSSTPLSSNLLIALGAAVLLGLEFAIARPRRPSRIRRPAPTRETVEA